MSEPVAERAPRDEGLDLRILTPGLTPEEVAAVTSVVASMIEEQRAAAESEPAALRNDWRRALEPHRGDH
ncbi:MAG: acyl-CoA carboxylase subunit epsilon [Microbacteriaceae bacterium]|nr:acyl-CoA carboxylase subunit epsilon [Microbacteriaceae bacterium]